MAKNSLTTSESLKLNPTQEAYKLAASVLVKNAGRKGGVAFLTAFCGAIATLHETLTEGKRVNRRLSGAESHDFADQWDRLTAVVASGNVPTFAAAPAAAPAAS